MQSIKKTIAHSRFDIVSIPNEMFSRNQFEIHFTLAGKKIFIKFFSSYPYLRKTWCGTDDIEAISTLATHKE